jgi:hypothetical protein
MLEMENILLSSIEIYDRNLYGYGIGTNAIKILPEEE